MQYRKFNLSKPREERMKDNSLKTFWDNVGTLTLFTKEDGSESGVVELVSFDKNIKLIAFPFKVKEQSKQDYSQPDVIDDYSQPSQDEINIKNIQF